MKSMSQDKPSGNILDNFLTDEDGSQLLSLQHYLSLPDQALEFEYENRIVDDIGQNKLTEIQHLKQMMTEEEYNAKIAQGLIMQDQDGIQNWVQKDSDGKMFREAWFNRVKELPR